MLNVRTYLVIALVFSQLDVVANACPFCSAISQSFREEMETMDVVVIVKLKSRSETREVDSACRREEARATVFEVSEVIKGKEYFDVGDTFRSRYLGMAQKGESLLAMASNAPNLSWATPLCLTERTERYLVELKNLPTGPEQLEFFQNYLEDEDATLARDAYNEFARASYADLIALKEKMNRERLLEFICKPDVLPLHRKLYFTMLGICGTQPDAKQLEEMFSSDDPKSKSGLDAMLACYVILSGEKGLNKIDELFLKNHDAEFPDTHAAIMAIRFHGSDVDVVPRQRLVKSLRHVLDRPEIADLVIPDLTRWEDWDVLPKLCDLFINADDESRFLRTPVINYLRACPLSIAKKKIEELKRIDADAVRNAMMEFSLSDTEIVSSLPTQPTAVPSVFATRQITEAESVTQPETTSIQPRNMVTSHLSSRTPSPVESSRKNSADDQARLSVKILAGVICFGMAVLVTALRLRVFA